MKPSYFDVHSHVNLETFAEREKEVIKEALDSGVWMINVGVDLETSQKAIKLAEGHSEGVYATAGLHPIRASEVPFEEDRFFELASLPKVVAIGECGLDYFHVTDPLGMEKQRQTFVAQIEMANRINKPLMLHIRSGPAGNAYADSISLLKRYARVSGNSHFFSGSLDEAKTFLSMGFTLSFTGVVTFTSDYDELVRLPPIDMIMAETDAPYVAPLLMRGKENRPAYVKEVAEEIARIRVEPDQEVTSALFNNACRMFGVCL